MKGSCRQIIRASRKASTIWRSFSFEKGCTPAILEAQQRQPEAEAIYRRGFTVEQSLMKRKQEDEAPSRESNMLGKGTLFLHCGHNWPIALAQVRGFTDKLLEGDERERSASRDLFSNNPVVKIRVRAAYHMGPGQAEFEEEGFAMAQRLLLNQAARAVSQLGARFGSGTGALAELIREQQDHLGRRKSIDKLLRDNYLGAQVSRIEESEETLRTSLAEEDKALDVIEVRLKTDFPNYAALARPEPLSIADVQAQLGNSEALVLFLDMDKWGRPPARRSPVKKLISGPSPRRRAVGSAANWGPSPLWRKLQRSAADSTLRIGLTQVDGWPLRTTTSSAKRRKSRAASAVSN